MYYTTTNMTIDSGFVFIVFKTKTLYIYIHMNMNIYIYMSTYVYIYICIEKVQNCMQRHTHIYIYKENCNQ